MDKFEYKRIAGPLDTKELNKLGIVGWELTATVDFGVGYTYIFKRKLPAKTK